jgi:phenylacetate-CoA ligase
MSGSAVTTAVEGAYRALSRVSPYTAWRHFERLQAQQWLSRDALDRLRWAKMQGLLAHAAEVPFYRDLWRSAGVEPARFTRLEDLENLPVVTRDDLRRAREADGFLLSRRRDFQFTHSSGTTGPRVYLPFTRDDLQIKYAAYLREFYATDWRLGVRSAANHYSGHPEFGGRYVGRPDRDNFVLIRSLAFRLAHRRILLAPYYKAESGDETVAAAWYRALRRHRPFLFETMEFGLLALRDYIRDRALPPLRIPRMFVLATLAPGLKRSLEEAFGTEIFDRYGPHEVEGVAYACHEHRGMHMAIDSVHTEFLDDADRPAGPGEQAHIVLTDLDSRLMPLIRYRIGDIGSYREGPCACGRGFPLMDEIAGRTRDRFDMGDGTRAVPTALVGALQENPAVRIFQLAQAADRGIEARVVPDQARWLAGEDTRIQATLAALAPGLPVHVVLVGAVGLESNGKFCYVKNHAHSHEPPVDDGGRSRGSSTGL